ncbi:MAG: type II toxin-antitoxin system VapC family toxin [Oscillospiraceae bacterium]|nr:type II toxin-antitoxin system VapC family toxin [Oscillospiraceae bacterium]
MIYALDSNILSYLLRDDDRVYSRYNEALDKGHHCIIPLIVYLEVKRGLKANDAAGKMRSFERFCNTLGVDDLNTSDVDVAADIYAAKKKTGRLIGDSDLLIAASCIARGYKLVTNNAKHFEGVEGLQFENWVE